MKNDLPERENRANRNDLSDIYKQQIIEHLLDGVVVVDQANIIIFVNPVACDLLGYTQSDLLGKPWTVIVPEDQHVSIADIYAQNKDGNVSHREVFALTKDGIRFPALVSGSPITVDGEYRGAIGIFSDLSRLKEAESRLQRQLGLEHEQVLLVQTLQELSSLIVSQLGLQEVLERILDLLGRVVHYDSVSIMLLDSDGVLNLAAGRGFSDLNIVRLSVREISSHILSIDGMQQDGQVIPDTLQSPAWRVRPGGEKIRSWVGAPLRAKGRLIGVLTMDSFQPDHYSQKTVQIVMGFANQAAVAIENARLFAAEHTARERAEALRDAAHIVNSSLSLDDVLQVVLSQLARVLLFDSGCVMLADDDEISIRTWRGYSVEDLSTIEQIRFNLQTDQTIGTVVRSGEPMLISDVREDPGWVETWISGHIRSWMGVPLLWRGQAIGLLSLDRMEPAGFTQDDIEQAQAFAVHASAAIQNARLFEAEEQRSAELLAVRQASLSLASSLNLGDVLDSILDSTLRFLPGTRNAYIFLYHQDETGKDHITFGAALWRDKEQRKPSTEPLPNPLVLNVVRTGQMIVIPDAGKHPLFRNRPKEANRQGALIGLPLKIGPRVVGIMNVSYPHPRAFMESELRVLNLLGDQAAVAIENARLYERVTIERRHMSLLYELARELTTSLSYTEILNRAATLTSQALNGIVGEGFLYDRATGRLKLVALYGREVESLEALNERMDARPGKGLAGWVAQTCKAVYIQDVYRDENWLPVKGLDDDVRSGIISPILEGDRLLGILTVLHQDVAGFSQEHLLLLQAICRQVALALTNAERYSQVQNLVRLLSEEQYRLESLLEHLPVGVLLLDDNYHLLVANLLGRRLLARLNGDERPDTVVHLGGYALEDLIHQRSDTLPVEILNSSSPRIFLEADARQVGEENRQWVVTIRDITQEKDNQVRVNMQERLATVGQLAAGIAHDFNNIMAAIMIYSDLLINDKGVAASSRERLQIIQQQVGRASSLIRQILDFSRRSVMEQSPLDLLPLLKEIIKLFERLLPETIRVRFSYESGAFMVNADPTRLQQVFMNLALNARDAMPDGGILKIRMGYLNLQQGERPPIVGMDPQRWVWVVFEDNGFGITTDALPHIFDPFFTTKPVGKGTGLGLAQVYGIIQQHGGFIDVGSEIGKGTIFTIYLPAISLMKEDTEAPGEFFVLQGNGKQVLVAEDDPTTRDALQALLQAYGFVTLPVANGVEALQLLHTKGDEISFVVTDVVMPEIGGIELYQKIRQQWPAKRVLFVTGHPLDDRNQSLLEEGDVFWLQKPFSAAEFGKILSAMLK